MQKLRRRWVLHTNCVYTRTRVARKHVSRPINLYPDSCRRTHVAGYMLLVRDTCWLYFGDIITIHLCHGRLQSWTWVQFLWPDPTRPDPKLTWNSGPDPSWPIVTRLTFIYRILNIKKYGFDLEKIQTNKKHTVTVNNTKSQFMHFILVLTPASLELISISDQMAYKIRSSKTSTWCIFIRHIWQWTRPDPTQPMDGSDPCPTRFVSRNRRATNWQQFCRRYKKHVDRCIRV